MYALVLTSQKRQIQSLSSGYNQQVANIVYDEEDCWISPGQFYPLRSLSHIDILVTLSAWCCHILWGIYLTDNYKNELNYHQPI